MKITTLFYGYLLMVLCYSKENCEMEGPQIWYIYKNVNITAYFCIENKTVNCENLNGKNVMNYSFYVDTNCTILDNTLCELSAKVKEEIIEFSTGKLCLYKYGTCHDGKIKGKLTWKTDCSFVQGIYRDYFQIWTETKNQNKYIRNENITLQLKKVRSLCRHNVWETNHNGITVSDRNISISFNNSVPLDFTDTVDKDCGILTNTTLRQSGIPETWYIFNYSVDVLVYHCRINNGKSCEIMEIGEFIPCNETMLNQCKNKFCSTSGCKYNQFNIMLCREILDVDLESNTVKKIPEVCKYSDGVCNSSETFWLHSDICNNLQNYYETCEKKESESRVICKNSSQEFVLLKTGILCGKTIWYTNKNGIVAFKDRLISSIECNSIHGDTDLKDDFISAVSKQKEKIRNMHCSILYLVIFITVYCLWYIFNAIINFFLLRRFVKNTQKRADKEKLHLLNCLSQSLTNRYIYMNQRQNESEIQTSNNIYQSIEN